MGFKMGARAVDAFGLWKDNVIVNLLHGGVSPALWCPDVVYELEPGLVWSYDSFGDMKNPASFI